MSTAALDIKKYRETAEAATPGPWERFDNGYWSVIGQSTFSVVSESRDSDGDRELITREKGSYENATFIATFNPETVLRLLDTIERYEAALKDLVERIDRNGGLGDYKGGPPFALARAREALRSDADENKP